MCQILEFKIHKSKSQQKITSKEIPQRATNAFTFIKIEWLITHKL